jgi:ankyrin repeat protein
MRTPGPRSKSCANPQKRPRSERRQILDAIKTGDLAKVKVLVEKDPKIVNERARNGMTALFAAVANRWLEIAESLISKDCGPAA